MSSRRSSARCPGGERPGAGATRRARGVALVTVVWLLALMTLLAGSALTVARVSAKQAAAHFAMARAEAIADSAIRRAILSLLEENPRRRWPADGSASTFEFHDTAVVVRLTDESGRVDLNGADAALLTALMAGNGIELGEAKTLAARIIDWRDADDEASEGGAEKEEYRRAGLGYGPRNAPFESVDELWGVLGMPTALRETLSASLTIYTGQIGVDPATAPEPVRAALEWADTRQWGERRWLMAGATAAALPDRAVAGRVFRIRSETEGSSAAREAVLRITGNLRKPMLVYAWASVATR